MLVERRLLLKQGCAFTVRIAVASELRACVRDPAGGCALPYGEQHLAEFESKYCYDRFWTEGGAAPNTRYLCNGHAMVVVGDASSQFYACRDRGVLA